MRPASLRPLAAALLLLAAPGLAAGAQMRAAAASPTGSSRGALAPGLLAITGVSVVPMASDTTLRDATVVVRDGRIAAVGPRARVRVPDGARVVDGRGKWLIPGLADMHVHLHSDGAEVHDSVASYELGAMLANGVTTARLMIGTPEHLVLRRLVAEGEVLGPQLWVASPQFAGAPAGGNERVVATADAARAAVREVKEAGYEFVKLTTDIGPDVHDAIVDEARRARLPVVGHVDPRVGVTRALAAGQQIEHLDGYFESILADSVAGRPSVSNYGVFRLESWATLDHVDDAKLARIAGETARAGVWSTPTLTVFNTAFAIGQTEAEVRARPDWRTMPPGHRAGYLRANARYWAPANAEVRTDARRRRYVEVRNGLTRAIHDSGGRILAGSDSPEWFHGYGWALHRELESLVSAGLAPYDALVAATRNPAEFLGASAEWGTIEPGKRGDLVLLSANPLDDIRHTAEIEGVVVGGRWLDRERLDAMIGDAAARLGGAAGSSAVR